MVGSIGSDRQELTGSASCAHVLVLFILQSELEQVHLAQQVPVFIAQPFDCFGQHCSLSCVVRIENRRRTQLVRRWCGGRVVMRVPGLGLADDSTQPHVRAICLFRAHCTQGATTLAAACRQAALEAIFARRRHSA